jgi:membrane protease YdiL (CAAX protease family)
MKNHKLGSIATYVSLAYVTSWTIWLIGILGIHDLTSISDDRFFWFLFAGSFAPTASALIVTAFSGGWKAVMSLLRRLIVLKVDWKVYGITFFLLPIIGITTYLGLGIDNRVSMSGIVTTAIAMMPLNALLGGIIFGIGPLGEEMGWRGFLQDRLQGHYNSVIIAIIIGFIWAAWHFPLAISFDDFRSGLGLWEFIVLYPVFTILLAFTMGHLWCWSKGSLFIAIFFHAVSNMTVDIYLLNARWWDFGDLTHLQIYLIILLVFALMASATELLSRKIFLCPKVHSDGPDHIDDKDLKGSP